MGFIERTEYLIERVSHRLLTIASQHKQGRDLLLGILSYSTYSEIRHFQDMTNQVPNFGIEATQR